MRVYGFQFANGVGDVNRVDLGFVQADHLAESSLGDEIDRGHAETGGQDAVEWGGRTTALDMSQHADADVFPGSPGNGVADPIADRSGSAVFLPFPWQLDAFRHNNDREAFAV